jgi:hypothetical protein
VQSWFARLGAVALAAFAAAYSAPSVKAADFGLPAASWLAPVAGADPANRFEARFGVFAHGVGGVEGVTASFQAEMVTPRVFDVGGPWAFLLPRVHAGGSVHFSGLTNFAYTGLLWTFPTYSGIFTELFVGPAIHDGELLRTATRAGLGCELLFHAGANVGYRINETWSVMATFEHLSNGKRMFNRDCGTNAARFGTNDGLNNYGMRVGYSF